MPITSFAKLTGKDGAITLHASRKYHISSVIAGEDFIRTYENPTLEVINQVSSHRKMQAIQNRERLRPIIETIIFCGRQNIALRGHRDDGRITTSETSVNEGNFRALLRFRVAAGDKILETHLANTSSKATYISKTTPNQLIDCCKEQIQTTIINRVKKPQFYAAIFDETTDIGHIEQLSLSLRYVHEGKIREDFLTFVDVYETIQTDDVENNERRLTGIALGHCVIDLLRTFELPLENCVGIGTDNCPVMASDVKGAVQEIIKFCVNAKRCPCFNHSLNNSLAKSSHVIQIRNTIGTMKSIISFVNSIAKKNKVFINHMNKSLRGLCETRWSERHSGVIQFQNCFNEIVKSRDEISGWQDKKTSSEAHSLIKAICDSDFIISTVCLSDILSTTRPLSLLLQSPSMDLICGNDALKNTINALKTRREEADTYFIDLFSTAKNLAENLKLSIELPQKRQTNRANYSGCSTAEEYYRKAIFIPLLNYIVLDLQERLPTETIESFNLLLLMPSAIINENGANILERVLSLGAHYSELLGLQAQNLVGEYIIWREFCNSENEKKKKIPETAVMVLEACSQIMYPTIYKLIKILATLPISVATAERTFSTLRRLKTWMRTRMDQERLTGMALLHTHYDIEVDIEQVIDNFAKSNRKNDFVL